MTYIAYRGGTLLIPSGTSGMHLFVIVTNKCQQKFHLLVSVTSIKPNISYDDACVFKGGEHEFIDHPSYVFYRLAQQRHSASITSGVDKGLFIPKDDIAEEHLNLICAGIENSDFIKPWAIQYYLKNRDI